MGGYLHTDIGTVVLLRARHAVIEDVHLGIGEVQISAVPVFGDPADPVDEIGYVPGGPMGRDYLRRDGYSEFLRNLFGYPYRLDRIASESEYVVIEFHVRSEHAGQDLAYPAVDRIGVVFGM